MPIMNPQTLARLFQGGPSNPLYGDTPPPNPAQPTGAPTGAPPASMTPPPPSPTPAPQPEAPPIQPGQIGAAMNPPQSKSDFLASNPVAMPARPRGDFSKIPEGQPGADSWGNRHNQLRGALGSLFAGMAEFGRPGEGFAMANRWADQNAQQRAYDQNQPVLKQKAENEQYNTALGQQQTATEIGKGQAETKNLQQNVPMLQRQQALLDKVRTLKESGKYSNDNDLFNAVLPEASTIPGLSRQQIVDAINSSKTLGSKYSITRDPQTQAPIELVDRQGNHYSQSNLPQDPEAKQMWNDAQTASQGKLSTEENKEKRVAGYAAERQAAGFQQAQTMEGRKAAQPHLTDINDAKEQQGMIEKLLGGKMNPASQTAAMFKMIGLEQPTGTHRIMPAEVEGIEHLGGLSDRLKQKLLNWKEGDRFSPDMVPDVISTAKILSQNKIKTANDNLESTFRNTGYKVPGTDAKGRLDKPEDYQDTAAPGGAGGAQHVPGGKAQGLQEGATGKGTDGKKYIVKGGVWVSQ